jgi:predicted amidohydrolase YtcJ
MEPYADEPENRGMRDHTFEKLEDILIHAARRRRQLAFHAIGDRTIHEFVNTFENLQKDYPWMRDLRIRLEHAQLIHKPDIPRIRDLGILICAQPSAMGTPEKDIALLGEERVEKSYAYRSLLDGGVELSFGSDMPGEPTFDPLLSIHYVVNRNGSEALTAREALVCYTRGSAYSEFKEKEKGSIEAGKLADLTLLSDDLLTCPSEKIKDIKVEMTIVGGNIVYRRSEKSQTDVPSG